MKNSIKNLIILLIIGILTSFLLSNLVNNTPIHYTKGNVRVKTIQKNSSMFMRNYSVIVVDNGIDKKLKFSGQPMYYEGENIEVYKSNGKLYETVQLIKMDTPIGYVYFGTIFANIVIIGCIVYQIIKLDKMKKQLNV